MPTTVFIDADGRVLATSLGELTESELRTSLLELFDVAANCCPDGRKQLKDDNEHTILWPLMTAPLIRGVILCLRWIAAFVVPPRRSQSYPTHPDRGHPSQKE